MNQATSRSSGTRSSGTRASGTRSESQPNAWIENATLCSLALLLWGWQTQLLFIALPMAIALEARHIIRQRWNVSANDIKEIAKLSGSLFALLFVVITITQKSVFIYTLLQWLPVAAFPLVMSQTYGLGVSQHLYQAFSNPYLPRQKIYRQQSFIDLHYAFMGLCILAASAADTDSFFFYSAATVLVGLILWPLRPQRASVVLWMLLFCLSVGLGFAGHQQLTQFQQQLEAQMIAMIGNYTSGIVNPDGTATSMGSVGRLKLSKRIIARVRTDDSDRFPLLLQEASYNHYQLAAWNATDSIFQPVPPAQEESAWVFAQASEQDSTLEISTDLERAEGILTLPRGITRIQNLPVEEMQRNQYGAVQVDAEGSTTYQVQFSAEAIVNLTEAPPNAFDLKVPKVDEEAIQRTLAEIFPEGTLQTLTQPAIANRIAAYFQDFTYTLDLIRPSASTSPVSDFLLNTRRGHCEYFASASALLLRAAGIPARYAVGYSAHEFSPLEGQYLVRSRDAHAWTLAYIENNWQIVDNTPPDWAAQERAQESVLGTFFRSISDFFSFIGFQVSLRIRQLGELGLKEVLIIIIPVAGYLVWRTAQQFQGKRQQVENASGRDRPLICYGLDSELYALEKQLAQQHSPRQSTESFSAWLNRLKPEISGLEPTALQDILSLHYRYRFDPQGLDSSQRQQLAVLCHQWTEQLEKPLQRLEENASAR